MTFSFSAGPACLKRETALQKQPPSIIPRCCGNYTRGGCNESQTDPPLWRLPVITLSSHSLSCCPTVPSAVSPAHVSQCKHWIQGRELAGRAARLLCYQRGTTCSPAAC